MSETSDIAKVPARRTVVAGVGVAGLTAALTACGGSESSSSGSANNATKSEQGGSSSTAASGGAAGGTQLATTSDIPSGGGKVFEAQKVVVTQPSSGEFKAFSAVCPHQGCLVNEVSGGSIVCPCHQSKFSTTDGSRQSGPATSGLAEAKITVEGSSIKLA
jgi:nitrite reductase/ring-hydroxylating ferredoxin subunit